MGETVSQSLHIPETNGIDLLHLLHKISKELYQ